MPLLVLHTMGRGTAVAPTGFSVAAEITSALRLPELRYYTELGTSLQREPAFSSAGRTEASKDVSRDQKPLLQRNRSRNGLANRRVDLLTPTGVGPPEEGAMAMDKDRMKGAATRAGGKIKQAAGDMTGDTKMQSEGKMDQAKGKAQNAMGSAKDALKK